MTVPKGGIMRLPILLAAFLALFATPAFALSIDNSTGMNEDGTAKFADPDEQQPNLLNAPLTAPSSSSSSGSSGNGIQLTPNGNVGLSVRNFGTSQQPDAFDQAYDHFGNK